MKDSAIVLILSGLANFILNVRGNKLSQGFVTGEEILRHFEYRLQVLSKRFMIV